MIFCHRHFPVYRPPTDRCHCCVNVEEARLLEGLFRSETDA